MRLLALPYTPSPNPERKAYTVELTVHVAVTGASGQISNHLLFMLASGKAQRCRTPTERLGITWSCVRAAVACRSLWWSA